MNEVCGCDLRAFFVDHVSGAKPLDVNRWLRLIGYRSVITREPALDSLGHPRPDLRLTATAYGGYGSAGGAAGALLRIGVGDPTSAWGRAGLLTGDQITALDGRRILTHADFRGALDSLRIGDRVAVDVIRAGQPVSTHVVVTGFDRTIVEIGELAEQTPRMRRAREIWLTGRESGLYRDR